MLHYMKHNRGENVHVYGPASYEIISISSIEIWQEEKELKSCLFHLGYKNLLRSYISGSTCHSEDKKTTEDRFAHGKSCVSPGNVSHIVLHCKHLLFSANIASKNPTQHWCS